MRRLVAALIPILVLAGPALAQERRPSGDAPPPPPIDEPLTTPPASTAATRDDGDVVTLREAVPGATEKVLPEARAVEDPPLPEKVRPSDTLAGEVTIRREGNNVVEEYRRSGSVYMVVVTPEQGVRYTYLDTDGDGRLEGDPREGRARPVYYTLYQWE